MTDNILSSYTIVSECKGYEVYNYKVNGMREPGVFYLYGSGGGINVQTILDIANEFVGQCKADDITVERWYEVFLLRVSVKQYKITDDTEIDIQW